MQEPGYEASVVLDFQSCTLYVHMLHVLFVSTQVNTGNSILSELTKAEMSKKVGHFGFSIRYTQENGTCMAVF